MHSVCYIQTCLFGHVSGSNGVHEPEILAKNSYRQTDFQNNVKILIQHSIPIIGFQVKAECLNIITNIFV